MDNPTIPLRYYCRNARLCLQKASFAKKAELVAEELQHLRSFETIVMVTLPAHPLYKKADNEVLELEDHLSDTKNRVKELEKVSHIKLPLERVHKSGYKVMPSSTQKESSMATLQKGLHSPEEQKESSIAASQKESHTPEKQRNSKARLTSGDGAMLSQANYPHWERMPAQIGKCFGCTTMKAVESPTHVPTLGTHSNKGVTSCLSPPGILMGNGNHSESPVPCTQKVMNGSLGDLTVNAATSATHMPTLRDHSNRNVTSCLPPRNILMGNGSHSVSTSVPFARNVMSRSLGDLAMNAVTSATHMPSLRDCSNRNVTSCLPPPDMLMGNVNHSESTSVPCPRNIMNQSLGDLTRNAVTSATQRPTLHDHSSGNVTSCLPPPGRLVGYGNHLESASLSCIQNGMNRGLGDLTTNAVTSVTHMPTMHIHSNKIVESCLTPGALTGNGNHSERSSIPCMEDVTSRSLGDSNQTNVSSFLHGKVTEEAAHVSYGTERDSFELQEHSSCEEESIHGSICSSACVHNHFSNSNVQKVGHNEDQGISQGNLANGNGIEESINNCSKCEDDADSMYSSSTNASMRRNFDSPYDDETSSQDSQQSGVDLLSLDSVFVDKGYEWHWVKPGTSETEKTRLREEVTVDEIKRGACMAEALNIKAEHECAVSNDVDKGYEWHSLKPGVSETEKTLVRERVAVNERKREACMAKALNPLIIQSELECAVPKDVDKGYEWHWVKPGVSETEKPIVTEEVTVKESTREVCMAKSLNALNIQSELECAAPNDGRTSEKAKPSEEDSIQGYEDPTLHSKAHAFPVKWPHITFCQTIEEQSDHLDCTFEHKIPACPRQTTFSNPVFDFNPLEGNRMSHDVNMLQQLQGNTDEEQKLDDLLGDFANVLSQVHNIVEEKPLKTGELPDFNGPVPLQVYHESSQKEAVEGIAVASKSSRWRQFLESKVNHEGTNKHQAKASSLGSHALQESKEECPAGGRKYSQVSNVSNVHHTEYHSCNLQVSSGEKETESMRRANQLAGMDEVNLLGKDLTQKFLLFESRINESLDGKLGSIIKGLERKCAWANKKLEEHALQVSSLKKHVDTWMLRLVSTNTNKYVTAEEMKIACKNLKVDMDRHSDTISRDLSSFKEEVITMFMAFEASNKNWKDSELEEKLDEEIWRIAEVFSERQERITAELRQDISQIKVDCEVTSRWKVEAQRLVELVRQCAEEFQKRTILQGKEEERLCTILQFDEFKNKTSIELANMQQMLDKLMRNDSGCTQAISKLETTVNSTLHNLQNIIEQNVKDVADKLAMLDDFEHHKEELEGRWRYEREKERALMMDKLETLSHLYLGGLDELRMALMNLKLGFGSKIEELAKYLDSPCDTRHGIYPALQQTEGVEANISLASELRAYAHSQPFNPSVTKEESCVCTAGDYSDVDKASACNSFQLSKSISQDMLGSEVMDRGNVTHITRMRPLLSLLEGADEGNIIRKGVSCKQNQHEQEFCGTTSILTKEKEIVKGAMLEVLGIVERAREMLDQIADARRQSAKLAEEMVEESASMKKRSNELGQGVVEEMGCTERGSIELYNKSVIPLKTKSSGPWTSGSTAIAVNNENFRDFKQVKGSCFRCQELAVSDNASWSENLLSELMGIQSLSSVFLGKATADVLALEDFENNFLGLMNASSLQLHAMVHKAVQEIAHKLQEKEGSEIKRVLESWEKVIEDDAATMRCANQELKEVKKRVSSILQLGNAFTQDLDVHLKSTETVITGNPLLLKIEALAKNNCECRKRDMIKSQQEIVKQDINCLNEKFNSMASLVEELKSNIKAPEQAEVYVKKIFESSQKMHELGKKMMKLESLQLDVAHKVREIQLKLRGAEASAAAWGPKYETATRVLNELETRLRMVESLLWQRLRTFDMNLPIKTSCYACIWMKQVCLQLPIPIVNAQMRKKCSNNLRASWSV